MVHLHQTLEEGVAIGTDDHESPILIRLEPHSMSLPPKKGRLEKGEEQVPKKRLLEK